MVAPVLELADGLSQVELFIQGLGEIGEVDVIHHPSERFDFVEQGLFLFGLLLFEVGVFLVIEEVVLEDDFFAVCTCS